MRQILGLVMVVILVMGYGMQDAGQREETLFEIIKAGQPRHPYQTEYEQMLYPCVRISSPAGTGSGVVFTTKSTKDTKEEVYILTACHVVEQENTVDIELYDSSSITGTVVITDTDKDLALIRTQINADFRIYEASLAPQDYTYYLFTPVYAVGCSLGLSPRPSSGILSALSASVVEISAPVLPGNSGGPVYDARTYEVIGIAVWVKVCQGQLVTTMAGIVPINEIYSFIENNAH